MNWMNRTNLERRKLVHDGELKIMTGIGPPLSLLVKFLAELKRFYPIGREVGVETGSGV